MGIDVYILLVYVVNHKVLYTHIILNFIYFIFVINRKTITFETKTDFFTYFDFLFSKKQNMFSFLMVINEHS